METRGHRVQALMVDAVLRPGLRRPHLQLASSTATLMLMRVVQIAIPDSLPSTLEDNVLSPSAATPFTRACCGWKWADYGRVTRPSANTGPAPAPNCAVHVVLPEGHTQSQREAPPRRRMAITEFKSSPQLLESCVQAGRRWAFAALFL